METIGEPQLDKLREIGLSEAEIAWLRTFDNVIQKILRGGATVARLAHNQEAEGSTPSPANPNRHPWPSIEEQEEYWRKREA